MDRIAVAEKALRAHKEQLATTHLLAAAIASAQSESVKSRAKGRELNGFALTQIRSALSIPDFFGRLEAQELEGHQLRQLGEYSQADEAYKRLEREASKLRDRKQRHLLLARSKRYQAEIAQIEKLNASRNDSNVGQGATRANALLRLSGTPLNTGKCVIDLRQPYGPFHGWDLIEQAEIHYLSVIVAHFISAAAIAEDQLGLSKSSYQLVLLELPKNRLLARDYHKRLRLAAETGLARVERAEGGEFDIDWLLPPVAPTPSNNPQNKSHTIGPASGDDGIP